MKEIVFKKDDPAACPSCGEYYIQDRVAGRDIYGHEAYEYALFRKSPWMLMWSFRRRKKAYEYLSEKTGLTRWDVVRRSGRVICNDREMLGVQAGDGTLWKLMKQTSPVQVWMRYGTDLQVTGWYMTYRECLEAAKERIAAENG